jgi:MFS family permease
MTLASAPSNRRNVAVLAFAQGLFQCIQSMSIATTPLAGYGLLGEDKALATVPIFLMHFAVMLTTWPASMLMAKVGRRAGFSLGAVFGMVSGGVSFAGIWWQSFPVLCAGAFLAGMSGAFAWYYRFAATDSAAPAYRAKAISLVMAGGVIAGFLGPQTAKWSVDFFSPVMFAGVYMMVALYALGMLLLVQFIRIPPLTKAEQSEPGRPMSEIIRQPAYPVALASSMLGYGVMTLVMSATPLAMLACGYNFSDSATVIQGHVIAMFLPSFFTGHLIARYGVLPVIATGALLEIGCALVNFAGVDFYNFLIANILVGLGWNFTYVGGSTLLTTTYKPSERAKVQASHDFCVYGSTALAAGVSGALAVKAGWSAINAVAIPVMLIVMMAALRLWMRQRRAAAAAVA